VRLAAGLLGAHVGRGAEHLAVERHGDLARGALGQAEIHDGGRAVVPDHDVRRFHVAVDDAVLMRVVERFGHRRHQGGRVPDREPAGA
jgi:hypothetical protein